MNLNSLTDVDNPQTKKLLLGVGVATFVGVLLLSRRADSSPGGSSTSSSPTFGGLSESGALELARLQAEAASEIRQLTAANAIKGQELQYQFQIASFAAPAAGRLCLSQTEYKRLPKTVRAAYNRQEKNGKVLIQAGPGGVCITPTAVGAGGHQPIVENSSSSGLFGGTTRSRGPAGTVQSQAAPAPGIAGVLEAITGALGRLGIRW